jgi:DNA-directed RNA polymerase subunit RPC12/RpoP
MKRMAEYRCAICGGQARDREPFDCSFCGRPLGICADANCGWCVRLFETDDPGDCEGCGYVPLDQLSAEARVAYERAIARLSAAAARQSDAHRQMEARSGPVYEVSRERSRLISEAWRAFGSPHRPQHFDITRPPDPTTPEGRAWHAWRAWRREKARLYRELGWGHWAPRLLDQSRAVR